MEGVEDIPGTALAEGMTWDWESFPEYLDALEKLPRTVDVGTHVPHGAVRAYVMGERGARNEAPTETDIARMSQIVEEGLRAGALGFSTSRTILHRSIDGELVPGTTATKDELIGIGRAMGRVGHGVFEMASDLQPRMERVRVDGRAQPRNRAARHLRGAAIDRQGTAARRADRRRWRAENAKGANIVAQIALRGNGIVMAWRGTRPSVPLRPAWAEIASKPWDEQLATLQRSGVPRAHASREDAGVPKATSSSFCMIVADGWFMQYAMDADFNYEPTQRETIMARAAAQGRQRRRIRLRPADGGRRHAASSISRSSTTPTAIWISSRRCRHATTA